MLGHALLERRPRQEDSDPGSSGQHSALRLNPTLVQSIDRAHRNLQPGSLQVASGELLEANINRSPTSYLKNPAEERARYKHDIDKEMTLLKLLSSEDGRCTSALAVHVAFAMLHRPFIGAVSWVCKLVPATMSSHTASVKVAWHLASRNFDLMAGSMDWTKQLVLRFDTL